VHEDYLGVQSAYEAMLDVSSYVNEVKRDNEMLQIISDVQESISGWNPEMAPLKEYGRLIKDGELKIRSHEDGNRQKLRYVFVFNRAVIFCKTNRVTIYFIFFFRILKSKVSSERRIDSPSHSNLHCPLVVLSDFLGADVSRFHVFGKWFADNPEVAF
jgi:hypothetical protein